MFCFSCFFFFFPLYNYHISIGHNPKHSFREMSFSTAFPPFRMSAVTFVFFSFLCFFVFLFIFLFFMIAYFAVVVVVFPCHGWEKIHNFGAAWYILVLYSTLSNSYTSLSILYSRSLISRAWLTLNRFWMFLFGKKRRLYSVHCRNP